MINELKNIIRKNDPDSFIYSPGHFDMRLKEELLRSHRLHIPFVYLQIPAYDFNSLGWEVRSDATIRAWKIAVLTVFANISNIDIKGYLWKNNGLGLILINRTDEDIQKIKKQILRNLRDADLLDKISLKPKEPFFVAHYCPVQVESQRKKTEEAMHKFNHVNQGFFTIQEFRYSGIWNNTWNRWFMDWIKRVIDFGGGFVALVLLFIPMLILALIVKFTSKGPIFFGQTRVGKDGDLFTMWKFRSMYTDAEERKEQLIKEGLNEHTDGPTFKMKNDPRITPIGRIIRKYSLDELPQFWNVLIGDMALVGPRPPVPKEVDEYLPWHKMRLAVKPGLTCHWQVSGRSEIGFEDWMRLDNKYVRHGDLKTDFSLLSRTVKTVVKGDGAY